MNRPEYWARSISACPRSAARRARFRRRFEPFDKRQVLAMAENEAADRGGLVAGSMRSASLPPPPIGMMLAPFHMPLAVLAEEHAESDAGAAIAFLAQLVEADEFRLAGVLRLDRSSDRRGADDHCTREARGCDQGLQMHSIPPSCINDKRSHR